MSSRESHPGVTALACIADGRVVHAQETAPTPSWGEVGVSVSPLFKAYLDEESCCSPRGGWVTWGTGKFRLQVDFLYNHLRLRSYSGYPEERQGREISVQRVDLDGYADQVVGTALYWRVSKESRFSPHVLLGLAYWRRAQYRCVAWDEPVVQIPPPPGYGPNALVYRVDFAEGEEQRCVDEPPFRSHVFGPVVGVGVDIPIGSRFFARAQARLIEVRLGVGLRF